MNNTISQLTQKAVQAAKNLDWDQAAQLNQKVLELQPKNLGALNRLGLAYLQQGKKHQAKQTFKSVLKLDKYNKIAKKNLTKIENNKVASINNFAQDSFIEEPGKAKNIELIRTADSDSLSTISIGQKCYLEPKSKYISVNTVQDDQYLGTLPKEISQRLIKLIKNGNTYTCSVQICHDEQCSVHLTEKSVSEKNKDFSSFPLISDEETPEDSASTQLEENYVLEDEEIPVEIVQTDHDIETTERSITDIETDD